MTALEAARRASLWTYPESPTWEQGRTAAVVRCAELLEAILGRLDSLGHDGIHGLIRDAARDYRHRRRLVWKRSAAKRKATIDARKRKGGAR